MSLSLCTSVNLQEIIRISELATVSSVKSPLSTGSCLGILDNCWCSLVSVNICLYGHLDAFILTFYRDIFKGVSVCNYVAL